MFQGRSIDQTQGMHSGKRDQCRASKGTMHWRPDSGHEKMDGAGRVATASAYFSNVNRM